MQGTYVVGFNDVYPWVWSVMLGVALTLAERRGAFQAAGTRVPVEFWTKNFLAVIVNVVLPAVVFGITMTHLGPLYCPNMDFWQTIGTLYLAGAPLGAHHLWLVVAKKRHWLPSGNLQKQEQETETVIPTLRGHIFWAVLSFGIPAFAAVSGWRIPF